MKMKTTMSLGLVALVMVHQDLQAMDKRDMALVGLGSVTGICAFIVAKGANKLWFKTPKTDEITKRLSTVENRVEITSDVVHGHIHLGHGKIDTNQEQILKDQIVVLQRKVDESEESYLAISKAVDQYKANSDKEDSDRKAAFFRLMQDMDDMKSLFRKRGPQKTDDVIMFSHDVSDDEKSDTSGSEDDTSDDGTNKEIY